MVEEVKVTIQAKDDDACGDQVGDPHERSRLSVSPGPDHGETTRVAGQKKMKRGKGWQTDAGHKAHEQCQEQTCRRIRLIFTATHTDGRYAMMRSARPLSPVPAASAGNAALAIEREQTNKLNTIHHMGKSFEETTSKVPEE